MSDLVYALQQYIDVELDSVAAELLELIHQLTH